MADFKETFGEEQINKNKEEAEALLNDEDKLEEFLEKLEAKLKLLPKVGDMLADIPLMVSMVRSYVKKEYTEIPAGSIISVIGALIYFVSPIDLLPDGIPGVGYVDDALVIAACCKLVDSDLQDYKKWRDNK